MNSNKKKLILGLAAAVVGAGALSPATARAGDPPPSTLCNGSTSWCEDVLSCDEWVDGNCVHKVKRTNYLDLP